MTSSPRLQDNMEDLSDEEALRYAIELSLQDAGAIVPSQDTISTSKKLETVDLTQDGGRSGSTFGNLVLDRKQMEADRLARLGKRARSPSPVEDAQGNRPAVKRQANSREKESTSLRAGTTSSSKAKQPVFPKGTVLRTWCDGFPRTGEDIKIEEVFLKDQLELAILSSFQWDEEWMLSKLDTTRTKLLLLAYAANESQKLSMASNAPPNVKFTFPPMNGPGAMHSKLQLLKYPAFLRIVVPTGNLVPYDWGETGSMENMVFLIDLPRMLDPVDYAPTDFSERLEEFMKCAGVERRLVGSLRKYDFSATKNLGFVCSIPGGHLGPDRTRTGYCSLGKTVNSLGMANSQPIEIDLACASLGSINDDLVEAMYRACQGDDGMQEFNSRAARKSTRNKGIAEIHKQHFRIYFPKDQTVRHSRGGKNAGGTICLQERWWQAPTFPRDLMRDCANTRTGLLMHSKLIFVRGTGSNDDGTTKPPAWAYVGSANLSESAWGRVVRDRATGQAKMSCRNWECGVVIPVPAYVLPGIETPSLPSIFKSTVPVPMQTPGDQYLPTDKPWFFMAA